MPYNLLHHHKIFYEKWKGLAFLFSWIYVKLHQGFYVLAVPMCSIHFIADATFCVDELFYALYGTVFGMF
jgi:hypothetical protein